MHSCMAEAAFIFSENISQISDFFRLKKLTPVRTVYPADLIRISFLPPVSLPQGSYLCEGAD